MADLNSNTKYLDLTGLTLYDGLIKAYSDAGDSELKDYVDGLVGEGGSVQEQIEDAIDDLKGNLSQDDSDTLEEINDRLDTIENDIDTLNGDNTTQGSVAKAVKDGIDAVGTGTAQGESGKAITSITQTNGVVTASAGNIDSRYVTVSWLGNDPVSTTTNVQDSLTELYGIVALNDEAGELSVWTDVNGTPTKVSEITEFGKTYTFKQGTTSVATMNLAKDMVVSGGSVITAVAADKAIDSNVEIGEKYIKLIIANSEDVLYIPVNSLYKDHTVEANASKIQLAISNDNVISASVKTGSIEKTDLVTSLQNEISSAATVVNAKNSGHVQVSVTAASGANPAEVTVTENDIASATDLSSEVTRAQAAEGEIAGKIGLSGLEGAKVYSTNITARDNTTTVVGDINNLDGRVSAIETWANNMTAITNQEINGLFSSGD